MKKILFMSFILTVSSFSQVSIVSPNSHFIFLDPGGQTKVLFTKVADTSKIDFYYCYLDSTNMVKVYTSTKKDSSFIWNIPKKEGLVRLYALINGVTIASTVELRIKIPLRNPDPMQTKQNYLRRSQINKRSGLK